MTVQTGDPAARGFMRYHEGLNPQIRARMGQRSYHDILKAFTSGFESGLGWAEETRCEPNLTPTKGAA